MDKACHVKMPKTSDENLSSEEIAVRAFKEHSNVRFIVVVSAFFGLAFRCYLGGRWLIYDPLSRLRNCRL